MSSESPQATIDANPAVDQALSPRLVRAYGYAKRGRTSEAEALCRDELTDKPGNLDAMFLLTGVLLTSGRANEAGEILKNALQLNPGGVEARVGVGGITLTKSRSPDDIIAEHRRVVGLSPDRAEAHYRLGVALFQQQRYADAVASFTHAIELRPDFVPAHRALVDALSKLERFETAASCARHALALKADDADLWSLLGYALAQLGRPEEFLAAARRAVQLRPGNPQHHVNLSYAYLSLGQYRDGFREYEYRWRRPANLAEQPGQFATVWSGEPLIGKKILVHNEIGLGDAIQFARFLPMLARTGAEVSFLVPPKLLRLMKPFGRFAELIGAVDPSRRYDFQCGLMSLPHWLGIELSNLPRDIPYLFAEEDRVAHWRRRLNRPGFKIGITWQGNPKWSVDKARSVPLRRFLPLARVAGVRLISLQMEHGLEQLEALPADMDVELLGPDFNAGEDAFLDTAAVMQCVDLVITSDTANAHLAGALGRPAWLALGSLPDWRWLLRRTDSPWYPTMRLFRQRQRGVWEDPFAEMATELTKAVEHRSAHVS